MAILSFRATPLLRWSCCLLLAGLLTACNDDNHDADAAGNKVVSTVRRADGSAVGGQVYSVGDHVLLQAPAGGAAGASYQWYRNGEAIDGATDASYELGQASSLDDQASFTVRISSANNPAGTLSQPLVLSVKAGEGVDLLAGYLGGDGYADGVGSAVRLGMPGSVARDDAGNLYVAESDNQAIRKISPAGVVSTLAGRVRPGGGMLNEVVDGIGAAARFRFLSEITMGRDGNLYAIDGALIRRVTPAGVVTTLAGSSNEWDVVDGTGATARFANPSDITQDTAGNLLVRDWGRLRRITPAGVVTTVARLPDYPQPTMVAFAGMRSRFKQPQDGISIPIVTRPPAKWQAGLVADVQGNVYIADPINDRLLKIGPDGAIGEEAQLGGRLAALLGSPDFWLVNATSDSSGNIYLLLTLAQTGSQSIVTLAADGGLSRMFTLDTGAADAIGDIVAAGGHVYATFAVSHTVQRIDADGKATRLAGSGEAFVGTRDGLGRAARFYAPVALVADSQGYGYVAGYDHTIRKIAPNGMVSTLAGKAGESGNQDGAGGSARFNKPSALAIDKAGNLYVADSNNNAIRIVSPAGMVSTLASGSISLDHPRGLAFDASGTLYVEDNSATIAAFSLGGVAGNRSFNSNWWWHNGLSSDAGGNLYAAFGYSIVKLTASGEMVTVAGDAARSGNSDGAGGDARFNGISGLAVDAAGNLYVADTLNHAIRKVTPAGVVSTVVGQAGVRGVQLGGILPGGLNQPASVAIGMRHGRPVLLVLNRASTWDWLRGYLDYPPGFGPESVTPYALSDVNVVTVPLP